MYHTSRQHIVCVNIRVCCFHRHVLGVISVFPLCRRELRVSMYQIHRHGSEHILLCKLTCILNNAHIIHMLSFRVSITDLLSLLLVCALG